MSTEPAGTFQNENNCQHYAGFMAHLEGHHFTAMYWSLFFLVIFMLFVTAGIFQWAMARREEHENGELDDKYFRKRWITAMILALTIFIITAVFCVMEVFALMALQFCQGEPLISLYWSSWMMLQIGSEVAILGIVLAMWLHLRGIDHPKWALALGTPVLVVAGFGHVFTHLAEKRLRKIKDERRFSRRLSRSTTLSRGGGTRRPTMEKERNCPSSANSIRREQPLIALTPNGSTRNDQASRLEAGLQASAAAVATTAASAPAASPSTTAAPTPARGAAPTYFALDAGDDERVKGWPAFMGLTDDGKAVLRLTPMSPSYVPSVVLPAMPAPGKT